MTAASLAGSASHRPEQLERHQARATAPCREKAAEKPQPRYSSPRPRSVCQQDSCSSSQKGTLLHGGVVTQFPPDPVLPQSPSTAKAGIRKRGGF